MTLPSLSSRLRLIFDPKRRQQPPRAFEEDVGREDAKLQALQRPIAGETGESGKERIDLLHRFQAALPVGTFERLTSACL